MPLPRASVWIDAENFRYGIYGAFGIDANYNVMDLAKAIANQNNFELTSVHFYSGIPRQESDPGMYQHWQKRIAAMEKDGVHVYTRSFMYDREPPYKSREKGIDTRICLDVQEAAYEKKFDVAFILSKDQDLNEIIGKVHKIALQQDRRMDVICAHVDNGISYLRGALQFEITREMYDRCLETRNFHTPGLFFGRRSLSPEAGPVESIQPSQFKSPKRRERPIERNSGVVSR